MMKIKNVTECFIDVTEKQWDDGWLRAAAWWEQSKSCTKVWDVDDDDD